MSHRNTQKCHHVLKKSRHYPPSPSPLKVQTNFHLNKGKSTQIPQNNWNLFEIRFVLRERNLNRIRLRPCPCLPSISVPSSTTFSEGRKEPSIARVEVALAHARPTSTKPPRNARHTYAENAYEVWAFQTRPHRVVPTVPSDANELLLGKKSLFLHLYNVLKV